MCLIKNSETDLHNRNMMTIIIFSYTCNVGFVRDGSSSNGGDVVSASSESASLASGFSFDLGSQRRPDVDVVSGSELKLGERVAGSMDDERG